MMTNHWLNFVRHSTLCVGMACTLASPSACQQTDRKIEPMFDMSLCAVYESRIEPRLYDDRKVDINTFQYFSVRGELFAVDDPNNYDTEAYLKDPQCPQWKMYVKFSQLSGLCRPSLKYEAYSQEEQDALTDLGMGGDYDAKGKRVLGHFTGYVIGVDEKKRVRAMVDCINHIQISGVNDQAARK